MEANEALRKILSLCYYGIRYSKKSQSIANTAMIALEMPYDMRQEVHAEITRRVEVLHENIAKFGFSKAKTIHKSVSDPFLEGADEC